MFAKLLHFKLLKLTHMYELNENKEKILKKTAQLMIKKYQKHLIISKLNKNIQ